MQPIMLQRVLQSLVCPVDRSIPAKSYEMQSYPCKDKHIPIGQNDSLHSFTWIDLSTF